MMRMLPVMKALDADGDGEISAKEIENAAAALKTLDKNDDGKLTADELRPEFPGPGRGPGGPDRGGFRGGGGEGRPQGGGFGRGGGEPGRFGGDRDQRPAGGPSPLVTRIFEQNDKNKDGKLTGDEIPERLQRMLDRADENDDGEIEKSELERMFGGFRAGGGGGGGFGRGRGDGGGRGFGGGEGRPPRPRRPEAEE
jgi:Ca2+-binding EF-hand superfamily protein